MNPRFLKSFACFYGGKWRIALKYPKPEYGTIIEPFSGLAGYSTRYYDRDIILIEADPAIAKMWQWLIQVSSAEINALPDIVDDLRKLNLSSEARTLIGFWLNKGGTTPCHIPSSWMRSNIRPNSYWGTIIRQRIANQVQYIRHWRVIHGDYSLAPNKEATWFIDPPYHAGGHKYKFNTIDYGMLNRWSMSRRGQVMVCEVEGADWLPFSPFVRAKANPGKTGGKIIREVLGIK